MACSASEPSLGISNTNVKCSQPQTDHLTDNHQENKEDMDVDEMINFPTETKALNRTIDDENLKMERKMSYEMGSTSPVINPSNSNHANQSLIKPTETIKQVVNAPNGNNRLIDITTNGKIDKNMNQTIIANEQSVVQKTKTGKNKRKNFQYRIEGLEDIDKEIQFNSNITIEQLNFYTFGQTMVVDDKDLLKAPLLGEGGSGKVYDVTDTKSNLRMAVKCIDTSKRKDPFTTAVTEFETIKQIGPKNGPSIVTYYNAIKKCTADYFELRICMEFMDMTLTKFYETMHSQGEVPPEILELLMRRIVYNIATALFFLEKEDIVHRDIKPDNILINKKGEIKLSDFGSCAKREELKTSGNHFVGTEIYTPPESAKDPIHDDMWKVGFTLLEIMLNKHPFPSPTSFTRTKQLLNHWKPEYPKTISDDMKQIISRLLEKQPSDRFQSFNDILQIPIIREVNPIPTNDELIFIRHIIDIGTKTDG